MEELLTHEECARRIVQRELRRPVMLHDDGSRPSMYDLRVGDRGGPDIAVECIGAVDRRRTETWNVGPARGSFILPIVGDWNVVVEPGAMIKRIRQQLLSVLNQCVEAGVSGFTPVDAFLRSSHPALFDRLKQLRIHSVSRYDPGTGRIFMGMTGFGGPVDPTGMEVPRWISEFLHGDDRQDVLRKLESSGAVECHVFVGVSFGGVPWLVESYLGTETDILPRESPVLPPPVHAVWITYGRKGLRWDGSAWAFFDAVVPARAD